MRYFLDTEFNEDAYSVTLISLALRAEDDRELYLVSSDFSLGSCNEWIMQHVIPHLHDVPANFVGPRAMLAKRVAEFVAGDKAVEFWGYYADYDWFLLCRLFGGLLNLPEGFPKLCMDIKQLLDTLAPGVPFKEHVPQDERAHNALFDARWNQRVYHWAIQRALKERVEHPGRWDAEGVIRGVDVSLGDMSIGVPGACLDT